MADRATRATTAVKVVVLGPPDVGKTTLVRTLSEINVLTTQREVPADPASPDAEPVTVSMDFGRLNIDEDLQLYLFGTSVHSDPGAIWTSLGEGVLGAVILVDHEQPQSYEEAITLIEYFTQRGDVPFVVAVNRVTADRADLSAKRARHQLRLDERVRLVAGDVREISVAKSMLLELFEAARESIAVPEAAVNGA